MGLTIPTSGRTYVDSNVVIYTVERHPRYGPLLRPLWLAVDRGSAHLEDDRLAGGGAARAVVIPLGKRR